MKLLFLLGNNSTDAKTSILLTMRTAVFNCFILTSTRTQGSQIFLVHYAKPREKVPNEHKI
jgi:hypothetical protein